MYENVLTCIKSVLQPQDNLLRANAQKQLTLLLDKNLQETVTAYLEIISKPNSQGEKVLACSQLRQALAEFKPGVNKRWFKINPTLRQNIRNALFQLTIAAKQRVVRKALCDLVGQTAGCITNNVSWDEWPFFKPCIYKMFTSSGSQQIQSAFLILQGFFGYSCDLFTQDTAQLYTIFSNGLAHPDLMVALAALKCISSYLSSVKLKQGKKLQTLIVKIYEVTVKLTQAKIDNSLEPLIDIVECQPKLFKKTIDLFLQLVKRLFDSDIEFGQKKMVIEMMVGFAESLPQSFRKSKERRQFILEMVFSCMVKISNKIEEEWAKPQEGFNQKQDNSDDSQTIKFGMTAVDRLISSIGQNQLLQIAASILFKMLASEDWRYQYAAVMSISQIGQYIDSIDKIAPVISKISQFFQSKNPMLKYALCHAIGQISDQLEGFSTHYYSTLLPLLIQTLQDPIPRVQSHAADALTNFLQTLKPEQIQPYLKTLVTLNVQIAKSGISICKQSSMACIGSIAQASQVLFVQYLDAVFHFIMQIYQSHPKKQYSVLRGMCCQTIGLICQAVGANHFRPYLQNVVKNLVQLTNSLEEQDPRKSYLLSAWQHVCLTFGEELGVWLQAVIPPLFKLVQKIMDVNQLQTIGDTKINTYETDETEIAISMLGVFIQKLDKSFKPYAISTCNLLLKILSNHINDEVREEAAKCLPILIKSIKDEQLSVDFVKTIISKIVQVAKKQFGGELLISLISSCKDCLDAINRPILTKSEIEQFSKQLIELMSSSENRKNVIQNQKNDEDEELQKQDVQIIEEDVKNQEEVQVAIGNLFGGIFKSHGELSVDIANLILKNVIPKSLQANQSEGVNKLGIYIIVDIIEFLPQFMRDHWKDFANVLVSFSQHRNVSVRQAAVYGIGVFAQRTQASLFPMFQTELTKCLISCTEIAQREQKQNQFIACRDNMIASIGKIIETHGSLFDVKELKDLIQFWLKNLPIRKDKQQAIKQHKFLLEILTKQPDYILLSVNSLYQVLRIFGDIVHKESLCKAQTKLMIKSFLNELKKNNLFLSNQSFLMGKLTPSQIQKLTELI